MSIVRCLLAPPPQTGLKRQNSRFPAKIALHLKKVCYKFLCVNTLHRRQSIGVYGVRTPPVLGRVVSTYMWTPSEFLTT